MKKTFFILTLISLLFFSSCEEENIGSGSVSNEVKGCTEPNSFNYNSDATHNDGTCKSRAGCLGYVVGSAYGGTKGITLGDSFYDQLTNEEVQIQRAFWGNVPTSFYILYENDNIPNAYADGNNREILFGRSMFYHILNSYGSLLPAAGVIAHEFAHRIQQELNYSYKKPEYQELEADAYSGFYMALVKNHPWNDINQFFHKTYMSGDTNFNSPQHHGTSQERAASARLGYEAGLYALQNNHQFSIAELHEYFISEIENRIAPRSGSLELEYSEIEYPENITEEYIKSLYPTF